MTRLGIWLTALCATLLLAGCAARGPDHTPLASITPAALGLSDAESAPVASRWWTTLGDERLNQLIEQALLGSPTLALARARMARAIALAELKDSSMAAQTTLNAELTRQRYSENGLVPPPIAGNSRSSGTLQAALSWSPDFFGQLGADLASALGQARAAQADAAAAATALAAQVSHGYIALGRLMAQHTLMERALAQRTQLADLTRERLAAGLDSQVEMALAEAALPEVRAQIALLDEQITLARRQIALLAGQAPQALDNLSVQLAALRLDSLPLGQGADLLGRRPDVVAARWRVEAALQDVGSAQAQFYPNVNLGAFVGLNALGLDRLLRAGSLQYGVSPALRLPLFDGGRLRAQLGARQADVDGTIAQYNAALLDAVREAGDALGSEQSLLLQQREQMAALTGAERVYALSLQRYRAGIGSFLVVLNTESPVLAQRRLAIDLRARQFDNRVALMKALGGGWNDDTVAVPGALR